MRHTVRISAGLGILVAGSVLGACATTPAKPDNLEAKGSPTTTSTTTPTIPAQMPRITVPTTAPPTTTAGVVVPDVIGLAPRETRLVLRSLGFALVPFDTPCQKGTTASQSVVTALSVPGPGADPRLGASPLAPGTARPARSRIGVTWSGCYPHGAIVPDVTGLTFDRAVHRLHLAGLDWACFSVAPERPPHGTTASSTATGERASHSSTDTSAPASSKSTTSATPHHATSSTSTSTTVAGQAPNLPKVLSQGTKPGTTLKAHTAVDFTMHHCPQ
jgi:hypothetical protein